MKRKIVSIVATAATAATLMAAPAYADGSVEENTYGSKAVAQSASSEPLGSVTNLGSAALQNPIGSVKFGATTGSAALVGPARAANLGSHTLAKMSENKVVADEGLKYAETDYDLGKNVQAFSHPQRLSDSQTTADKAILGLAFIGIVIAALSFLGLAPQMIPGLPMPGR